MTDHCPACGKMLKEGYINHGSIILYIHDEVPSKSSFRKTPVIATRTYSCCSLDKYSGEKGKGYFCIYTGGLPEHQGTYHIKPSIEESLKSELAAEVNNALAVILGNAQLLLLRNKVPAEDRAKLRAIELSSFRILELVKRMLTLNRWMTIT